MSNRRPPRPRRRPALLLALLLAPLLASLLAACDGLDPEQARVCESLLRALEPRHAEASGIRTEKDPVGSSTVAVWYQLAAPGGELRDHWIRCRFAGAGFDRDRLDLAAVSTDRDGDLGVARLYMLRRFWLGAFGVQGTAAVAPPGAPPGWLYLAQQAVNAVSVGSVYALLAMAYALVFGLIRRINLAFGELAMIGAFVAVLSVYLFAGAAGFRLIATVPLAALGAGATAAVYGWATGRAVYRPLRHRRPQVFLVATVGLGIALRSFVHRTQEVSERWLQPAFNAPQVLMSDGGFTVVATAFKMAMVALAGILFLGLMWLMTRTGFGRAWRACADDPGMAALCGVSPGRVIGVTFALSGLFAGLSGALIALLYGSVHIQMGIMFGFKALTAAVVGGIGSLPGALVGGLAVAAVETLWSAYFDISYRDITVFALLALFLVFRPDGLFGGGPRRFGAVGFRRNGV
ncbi:MAG: branched-chain amino acid ABC transporter permease [Hyphomicrobiales bacterium]|nr:branched-chain amino acid ABC transporter permease [Hyphomicrobiales bacterium]